VSPNVEELGRLLITNGPIGDELPWADIDNSWGIAFPEDYKEFLQNYGAGSFSEYLDISAPFPDGHAAFRVGHRIVPLDAEMLDELKCPYPPYPKAGGVIAFGATMNGDTLLYRTSGKPSEWRIVTWSRAGRPPAARWAEYDLGFVDFMLALLNAQLPKNPFGGTDLWGAGRVRFIHWSESVH
jgi:hypothetical protein